MVKGPKQPIYTTIDSAAKKDNISINYEQKRRHQTIRWRYFTRRFGWLLNVGIRKNALVLTVSHRNSSQKQIDTHYPFSNKGVEFLREKIERTLGGKHGVLTFDDGSIVAFSPCVGPNKANPAMVNFLYMSPDQPTINLDVSSGVIITILAGSEKVATTPSTAS